MAAASPTPLHVFPAGGTTAHHRLARRPSRPTVVRRDSPLSSLAHSSGFSSGAAPLRSMAVGDDSDDDLQPPPQLSALGRSFLSNGVAQAAAEQAAQAVARQAANSASPLGHNMQDLRAGRPTKLKISRSNQAGTSSRVPQVGSNTPPHDSKTPAASIRVKRVGLQGAPVRRARRTPQSNEEDGEPPRFDQGQFDYLPSQDQENLPVLLQRPSSAKEFIASADRGAMLAQNDPGPVLKPSEGPERVLIVHRDRSHGENPAPLAPKSVNTPHRPAPPPPPKMSVLETATAAAGASTTKTKKKRTHFVLNGKILSSLQRLGKGGSSEVWQVMAENAKMFALKKVKLAGADEATIAGYKGEIDLLKKMQKVDRVVQFYDYQVDEQRQLLYVLMEMGDCDMKTVLRLKMDPMATDVSSSASSPDKLDVCFTRYWWKEMVTCVAAVHEKDIVHTDLKPANFVVVKGKLKLIDFGISNAIDVENTVNIHRDNPVGTPNYMSPESLQDSGVTPQSQVGADQKLRMGKFMRLGKPSDVWSLGCILYEMTYGRAPFAHIPNPYQRVMAIINPKHIISFPSIGLGGVKVPFELMYTMKSCLRRDPSERPTAHELLASDDPFLYPEAVAALRIPQELLGQIIWKVAVRFRDKSKEAPTDEEIEQYAGSFYSKIRGWADEGYPYLQQKSQKGDAAGSGGLMTGSSTTGSQGSHASVHSSEKKTR